MKMSKKQPLTEAQKLARFKKVAKSNSFSGHKESSQELSSTLIQMEKTVGFRLFIRGTGGRLTIAGKHHYEKILREEQKKKDALAAKKRKEQEEKEAQERQKAERQKEQEQVVEEQKQFAEKLKKSREKIEAYKEVVETVDLEPNTASVKKEKNLGIVVVAIILAIIALSVYSHFSSNDLPSFMDLFTGDK